MGKKIEKGTPKALAKAMESKGLKKLRFWCQMCERQCGDAHGFRLHCQSEGHVRQMKVFAEDQRSITGEYSRDFEKSFMALVKQKYFTKMVKANKVYMEYISDKLHLHMNATQWPSLNSFVKHLEQTNKCQVEWTEKGPYIMYVDRSPQTIAIKAEMQRRAANKLVSQNKSDDLLQRQIDKANECQQKIIMQQTMQEQQHQQGEYNQQHVQEIQNPIPISFQISNNNSQISNANKINNINSNLKRIPLSGRNEFEKESVNAFTVLNKKQKEISENTQKAQQKQNIIQEDKDNLNGKRTKSGIEQLYEEIKKVQTQNKQVHANTHTNKNASVEEEVNKNNQDQGWLFVGLIVKIKDKKLQNGKYYRMKGEVMSLESEFVCNVRVRISKKEDVILKMDQAYLEPVVPKVQGIVAVLKRGGHHKKLAMVEALDMSCKMATLKLIESSQEVVRLPFSLICKVKSDQI